MDSTVTMTTESRKEHRKASKPLMEKKRRARINNCLMQLKSMILETMKKENTHYSKLEKADILEMTVKHLRKLHLDQKSVNDSKDVSKYSAGFHACFQEVQRYLSNECTSGTSDVVKKQLVGHLGGYMQDAKTNSSSAPCMTHPNIAAKDHGNDGALQFVLPFKNTGNAAEMPQPPTSPLGGATGVQMPVNFLYAMPTTKQNPETREGTGVQVHMSPRAPSESHATQSAPNSNIAYVIPVNAIRTHEANGHVIPVYANVQQLQNFSMVVPQVHDVKPTMNNAVPFPLPVDNNNNNMVHHNNDNHQLIGPGLPVQNPKQEDTMWRPW